MSTAAYAVIRPSKHSNPAPVPKTQRVAIAEKHGAKTIQVKESEPVREPKEGEVLVHIVRTGVCHTDLHAVSGDWEVKSKLPVIAGHEGAGYVAKLGPGITDLSVGDRVGIKWVQSTCEKCEYCLTGRETVCPSQERTGFSCDGSFQEYAIANAAHVVPIPEEVSFDQAAPLLCAGVTVYKGLKETEVKPGQWVVISGSGGGLGHLAVQYAKAMGMLVVGVDSGAKEAFCKKLGVDAFFDFKQKEDLTESIIKVTRGGAHGALLAVATPEPYQQALAYLRPWGTLVSLGLPSHGAKIPCDIFDLVMRRLTVRGSIVGTRADANEAFAIAARGQVKVHLAVEPLSNIPDVIDRMIQGKIEGRIVLDTSK
ncbi:alcohol dehydrogenase [Thoreauomyces humboldtii]|nr:alcohol dehydrogenase [Thoreauomyces humboldtii]